MFPVITINTFGMKKGFFDLFINFYCIIIFNYLKKGPSIYGLIFYCYV